MNKQFLFISISIAIGIIGCTKTNINTNEGFTNTSFSHNDAVKQGIDDVMTNYIKKKTPPKNTTNIKPIIKESIAQVTEEKSPQKKSILTALPPLIESKKRTNILKATTLSSLDKVKTKQTETLITTKVSSVDKPVIPNNSYYNYDRPKITLTSYSSSNYGGNDNITNTSTYSNTQTDLSNNDSDKNNSHLNSDSDTDSDVSSSISNSISGYPAQAKTNLVTPSPSSLFSTDHSGYVIQVIASSIISKALSIKDDFINEGYHAFINNSEKKGSMLYRVQIGPFDTKKAAKTKLLEIQKQMVNNPLINNAFVHHNT